MERIGNHDDFFQTGMVRRQIGLSREQPDGKSYIKKTVDEQGAVNMMHIITWHDVAGRWYSVKMMRVMETVRPCPGLAAESKMLR